MNRLQLEQLISAYFDDELSPKRKLEVKNLLQSDPAAQKLYDEFVAIRDEIRRTQRRNLPHDFQKQLFDRIDRDTVKVSEKHVEQNTSVDFTIPVHAETQAQWQRCEPIAITNPRRSELLTRLTNPRVWVAPTVALVCCLILFAVVLYRDNQNIAQIPPENPFVVEPFVVEPSESPFRMDVPPPSLPDSGSIPESGVSQSLAFRDGKPIVEMTCELSPTARDSQYIPKLLADNGYSYIMRENGNKAVTVYEFEIPAEQVLSVISMLRESNREELKSYKYPNAFLTLLNRSPETGDHSEDMPTVSTIIVRLNATKM
ncbi:MAG: RseA family anti-sigma factor [Planctomycetaceae bacterium]|nr:RseA family anti-sigma factor [Planctomycetaceae bacterium]